MSERELTTSVVDGACRACGWTGVNQHENGPACDKCGRRVTNERSDHAHPLVASAQQVARSNPSRCPSCATSMATSHEDWCRFDKRQQVAQVVEWAAIWASSREHDDNEGEGQAAIALEGLIRGHRGR